MAFWYEAPDGADLARISYKDETHVVPLTDRYFLLVLWNVPFDAEWFNEVQIVGHRINGTWHERSASELRKERQQRAAATKRFAELRQATRSSPAAMGLYREEPKNSEPLEDD
jgi:hypothetical protein